MIQLAFVKCSLSLDVRLERCTSESGVVGFWLLGLSCLE